MMFYEEEYFYTGNLPSVIRNQIKIITKDR
jgi:hypothetical protein